MTFGEQNKSGGHWVPRLLNDCDLQYGIYPGSLPGTFDLHCFRCPLWLHGVEWPDIVYNIIGVILLVIIVAGCIFITE